MSLFSIGNSSKNNKNSSAITSIISMVIVVVILVVFIKNGNVDDLLSLVSFDDISNYTNDYEGNDLVIRYLDVGQTDSVLIHLPNDENMIIDAGNTETLKYLDEYNIGTIDYMIMTHPHSDHIAGMAKVMEKCSVRKIYMPEIADDLLPTTKVFENFLDTADRLGIDVNEIRRDEKIVDGGGLTVETLAPNRLDYSDLNDSSIVTRLQFGNNVFIFSGDAEGISEKEILERYPADFLKADVLMCGHHGSSSSSTAEYLAVVKPEYAVISCGEGNKYGHPTPETLKRLKDINAKIYRTDLNGTVTCTSDGKTVTFNVEKGSYSR